MDSILGGLCPCGMPMRVQNVGKIQGIPLETNALMSPTTLADHTLE